MRDTSRRGSAPLLLVLMLAGGCAHTALGPEATADPAPRARPILSAAREPPPIRSQHPFLMTFLDFEMRGARTAPAGRSRIETGVTYTSMYQVHERGGDRARFDGEWARATVDLRFGLTDRLELFAALPFLYTTSGFLDGFVVDYHDAFGLNQDGRDRAPRNEFNVTLMKGGKTVYRLEEDTLGLGDIPIGLAVETVEEGDSTPGVLVRAAVELPTGNENHGFGNGKFDLGLGLVAEKSVGVLTFTGGVDYAWIRRADTMHGTGVDLEDLRGAFLNAGLEVTSWLAGHAALDYLSQPLSGLHLKEARRDQLMLVLGAAADLGRGAVARFDILEDLIADVSPDFSVRLGLGLRF